MPSFLVPHLHAFGGIIYFSVVDSWRYKTSNILTGDILDIRMG